MFRCHLMAAYKRCELDLNAKPSMELLLSVESRIPSIRAYETLVTALFLNAEVSSVTCSEREDILGDISPRLLAVTLLFLASSGVRRHLCDSLVAVCVSI